MNWSAYSRYVGDIFGAPLAIEGLAAFFIESTFLGLWIFGWDHLKPKVHLATIWLVAIGSTASAYFILAANSWMQHPVGYKINPVTHRAEMTSICPAPHELDAHPRVRAHDRRGRAHGVDARPRRRRLAPAQAAARSRMFAPVARIALWATLAAGVATVLLGHAQGQLMTKQQPMKMAAAEALYKTEKGARFSLFDIGPWEKHPTKSLVSIAIPHGLSILADNSWNGDRRGDQRHPGSSTCRSTAPATTSRSSASRTGRSGSWPDSASSPSSSPSPASGSRACPAGSSAAAASSGSPSSGIAPAARREPHRLAVHRARPPAVGRAGAAADEERRLADRRPWSVGLTLVGFTALYGDPRRRRGEADDRRRQGRARPRRHVRPRRDGHTPSTIPALTY